VNITETSQALALAQAFDNRTVGEINVRAWHAVLGDLDAADVMEAIRRHYDQSTEWLMPAHVRRLVEAIGQERAKAGRRWAAGQAGVAPEDAMPELPPGEATIGISPDVQRLLDELRQKLTDGDRAKLFPRQMYWEREQQAFVRVRDGEPNPMYKPVRWADDAIPFGQHYRPQTGEPMSTCGVPSPHPGHEWQIEANEGEAEPDKFWCPGIGPCVVVGEMCTTHRRHASRCAPGVDG